MVRMLNDLEVNSVSIERAKEYTEIPSEVIYHLNYINNIVIIFIWVVLGLSKKYCNCLFLYVHSQAEWKNPNVRLPDGWPTAGRIQFHNYQTRYREGLDLVLKGLSFEVLPSEKVGICGRTGNLRFAIHV